VVLALVACGSNDDKVSFPGTGGKAGGNAGSPGAGGAGTTGGTANGGGSGGTGGDPSACHPSNFSTAPLECLQDWSHATAKYKAKCKMDGGYQAHCDPYDAILVDSGNDTVACFYETSTGNLIGARSTENGLSTCVAFDTTFTEPERTACTPAEGGCSGMP
jgi:hypothetical protein